ncbi:MAG TPA: DUF697 domain-containing protein [Synechococcales cyanobacterium M55_K2018_004]|nr:DUF697 domain-containing protein [Synechococcales cyanobacterium M55_K2018_004]
MVYAGLQADHYQRARTSLRQTLNRYAGKLRLSKRNDATVELQASLKTDLNQISNALDKLNCNLARIAIFGLVSRGKSAVVNALIGQKLLPTGPLHGVTQYPRSVYWSLPTGDLRVELVDTPGLDEVGGQTRAAMAREVAYQADLIVFVIAGDMTRTEYLALAELQDAHKPIILVFNKMDLYPDQDRQAIYQKLQTLFAQNGGDPNQPFLQPEDIVLVAAEPAPIQVRTEWADGRVTDEWETLPPQIDELRDKLLHILTHEGRSLMAVNALRQARQVEEAIAQKTLQLHADEAEELIWQFARWKAIAVAVNPIAALDLLGGAFADLLMIRALARLYDLPMTNHEANKLLRSILFSAGGLLLGEVGTGLVLGAGKSAAAAVSLFDGMSGAMAYGGAAIAQASLAGYGSYRVGKAAQLYLAQGCTWGPEGANTVIRSIFNDVDRDTVIHRLRRELVTGE